MSAVPAGRCSSLRVGGGRITRAYLGGIAQLDGCRWLSDVLVNSGNMDCKLDAAGREVAPPFFLFHR